MSGAAGRFITRNLIRLFLIAVSVVMLYPFIWNILASFKTNNEFLTRPSALPSGIAWDNFVRAFTKAKMADYFLNSIFVVALSAVILLLFVIPISYALARYRFPGSKIISNLYMICIFIQATYIMIPLYLQMNNLKMLDNLGAISLVYAVMQFPFSIFVLSGFIRAVPRDYEEAARIDGCGNFAMLYKIIVPLATPGIATVTMLAAMGFWNEYPLALVLLQTPEKKTLPIGLANLFQVQKYATDWGALFAALTIILIPTVAIYLVGQKSLLKGIGAGGIKE